MGGLFSKSEPAKTPAAAGPSPTAAPHDMSVGKGQSAKFDSKSNKNIGKLTSEAGGSVTFGGLQNLGSFNLQNLRQEQQMQTLDLTNLAPIEQKLLMQLQQERASNPAAYVNHLAQLL